jgi:hypothetical protein
MCRRPGKPRFYLLIGSKGMPSYLTQSGRIDTRGSGALLLAYRILHEMVWFCSAGILPAIGGRLTLDAAG